MKEIRIGIIGLGMGRIHLEGYAGASGARVVGLADLNEERLRTMKPNVPEARLYTDAEEMLREERPDLVSVALPNFLHEKVTFMALEAGAHVLCEKPMSMDVESALHMRDKAAACGKHLFINFSKRFGPVGRAAKSLVEEGALGEIYHGYCQWTRRGGIPGFGGWFGQKDKSGGGPLIDLGVHELDQVLWLMGKAKPSTVSGMAHYRRGLEQARKEGKAFDVEDFATGFIRTDTGASILFEVSWDGYQVKKEQHCLRLHGEKGTIETAPGPHGDYTLHLCHDIGGRAFNSVPLQQESATNAYETLVHCLLEGRPFPATAEDGIRIQIILDALYESATTGREVDVGSFAGKALAYL